MLQSITTYEFTSHDNKVKNERSIYRTMPERLYECMNDRGIRNFSTLFVVINDLS